MRYLRSISVSICFLLGLVLFNSCDRDFDLSNPSKPSNIEDLKKIFESNNYDLNQQLNDSVKIIWQPLWEQSSKHALNDSVSYFYIPTKPRLAVFGKGNINELGSHVSLLGFTKYVVIEVSNVNKFYLAKYYGESDKPVNMISFTGRLLLDNLDNSEKLFADFVNGKRDFSQQKQNKGGRLNYYECMYIDICTWHTNPFCNEFAIAETRSSSSNSWCPHPSGTPGYGCHDVDGEMWYFSDVRNEYYCFWNGSPPPPPPPTYPPDGGGGGGGNNNGLLSTSPGTTPIAEFSPQEKCAGLAQMWSDGVNNRKETYGVITQDGSLLFTQRSDREMGGPFNGLYEQGGTTYYRYPIDGNTPTYPGTVVSPSLNSYFVPIIATVHMHTPCAMDNSDGITNRNGDDDFPMAQHYNMIDHYVVGCDKIAQFNSNSYFNFQSGSLASNCGSIGTP